MVKGTRERRQPSPGVDQTYLAEVFSRFAMEATSVREKRKLPLVDSFNLRTEICKAAETWKRHHQDVFWGLYSITSELIFCLEPKIDIEIKATLVNFPLNCNSHTIKVTHSSIQVCDFSMFTVVQP